MNPRPTRGLALVPLALLFSSAVAQAWTRGHPSELIPEQMTKVLALEGGGALVLGANYRYVGSQYERSDVLVRVGPEDEVAALAHPDAGSLRDAAVRGPELWVLGSQAVLYRNGQQDWKVISLPAGVSCGTGTYSPNDILDATSVRDSNIVATEPAHSAVTCTDSGEDPRVPRATTALILDADHGVLARYDFKDLAMGLLVPDGDGGFWTYVDGRRAYCMDGSKGCQWMMGAARYSKGKWTLWSTGSPVPEGFDVTKSEAKFPRSNFAAEDGAGGYWLISDNGIRTHVQPTGVSVSNSPPFGRPGPAAFDRRTGDLLCLVNDWRYRRDGNFGELARLGPDGQVRKQSTVPMPSAARNLESRDGLQVNSISPGSDEIWLSSGNSFLIRRRGGTWTFYWSPSEVASFTKESYAGRWALGALLASPAGIFGGAGINGEKYWATATQTLSGSLLGAMPLLLSPSEMQVVVAHGPSACIAGSPLGCLFYGGEAAATAVLAGLGTFAAGESMSGSRRTGAAFGGAMAGAFAAIVPTALLSLLLSEILPDGITVGVDLGLIGSGAAIGYQWAGGGRTR